MTTSDLHQFPASHPTSQRERISLARIDPAECARRMWKNHERAAKKAAAKSEAAASGFEIGQAVVTRRRERGSIVAIDNGNITIDINGSIRVFKADFIAAA